jgi:hypothetical protein
MQWVIHESYVDKDIMGITNISFGRIALLQATLGKGIQCSWMFKTLHDYMTYSTQLGLN